MPHKTRQRIINILEQRESATARELSRMLNVTPSNIRHHISILIEQGSLKIVGYKEYQSRGRPSAVYSLIQSNLKNNLDLLSSILLDKFEDTAPANSQAEKLRWLAQRLAAQFPQNPHNPTQRLYSSIQTLNQLNYHVQWEAHAESPRVMFRHCPYLAILDEHPEMCQVDEYLIECLTGDPAKLISKQAPTQDGYRQCVFRIMKK